MKNILFTLVVSILFFTAFGQETNPKVIRRISQAFDSVEFQKGRNEFVWERALNHQNISAFNIPDTATFITKIVDSKDVYLKDSKLHFALLETRVLYNETVENILSMLVFREDNDPENWTLLQNQYLCQNSLYGRSPSFKWMDYSESVAGIVIKPVGTNMGITTEKWIFFAFIDNEMKNVLEIDEAYFDNFGACEGDECKIYKTELKMIQGKEWNTISLEKTGRRPHAEEFPKHFSLQKETYIFDPEKGKYQMNQMELR